MKTLFLFLVAAGPAMAAQDVTIEDLTIVAEHGVESMEMEQAMVLPNQGGTFPNSITRGTYPDTYTNSNWPNSVTSGNFPSILNSGNYPNQYISGSVQPNAEAGAEIPMPNMDL